MTIIEQLEDADKTLAADGYKEYSYVRIAISEAIRALRQPPVSGELPLFKCKCGYETSNSVAWCVHADCCNGNDR